MLEHQYISKVDIVYNHLLSQFINGVYKANDRIVISQVANECGVSEIPVREALKRLESEGYIILYPHKGAIFNGLDKKSIAEMAEIIGVLEGYIYRLCAMSISEEGLRGLLDMDAAMIDALKANDQQKYMLYFSKYFDIMYKYVNNKMLVEQLSTLMNRLHVVFTATFSKRVSSTSGCYRKQIIELMKTHRLDEMETLVRQMIREFTQNFLDKIE